MLYYKSTGNGKTILFIHGSSQSSAIWANLMKEQLLATYTLISIDLPGHGQSFRSTHPEDDYTLKGMAVHLKGFLESLTEEYIIVANSLASNIVAEIVIQLTQCKGVFLTGACVIGSKFTLSEIVKPGPYFQAVITGTPTNEEVDGLIGTWAEQIAAALKGDFIRIYWSTDPAVRTQLGITIAKSDWSDEVVNLEQLEYPVAVVYGVDEKIIFSDYLDRSAIRMWRNGIIKIPGAGHCPQLDQPTELAGLINQYASELFKSAGS